MKLSVVKVSQRWLLLAHSHARLLVTWSGHQRACQYFRQKSQKQQLRWLSQATNKENDRPCLVTQPLVFAGSLSHLIRLNDVFQVKHPRQKAGFYANELIWCHDIMSPSNELACDINIIPSLVARKSYLIGLKSPLCPKFANLPHAIRKR